MSNTPHPAFAALAASSLYPLNQRLGDAASKVKTDVASAPEVTDAGSNFDPWSDTYIKSPKWIRVGDVVAVVIDLRNSTRLGMNKWAASTASIYEAATGTAVQLLGGFNPDFVAIQGDGAFALYWGDNRYERALCAAITVKTFSEKHLVPQLTRKWDDLPETGFKIGIASSALLVKRIGIPRSDHQEPVWPGKAVNYATKAAQAACPGQLVVTDSVWRYFENNEYVTYTCGCGGGPTFDLWDDFEIEVLPDNEPERLGRVLKSAWCDIHGEEFCNAVIAGDRTRTDVQMFRAARNAALAKSVLRQRSDQQRNIRRGLAS